MEDGITLEKLKINERLQSVEKEVALLTQAITELKNSKNEVHVHLQTELGLMHNTLYGTGEEDKPGLIVIVDRIKQSEILKNWVMAGIATVTIALVVTRIWKVLFP